MIRLFLLLAQRGLPLRFGSFAFWYLVSGIWYLYESYRVACLLLAYWLLVSAWVSSSVRFVPRSGIWYLVDCTLVSGILHRSNRLSDCQWV